MEMENLVPWNFSRSWQYEECMMIKDQGPGQPWHTGQSVVCEDDLDISPHNIFFREQSITGCFRS